MSRGKIYWLSNEYKILPKGQPSRVHVIQKSPNLKSGSSFISVNKLDKNYIVRWYKDTYFYQKRWFSDMQNGTLQFEPDSSSDEKETMQRIYEEILTHDVLDK